MICFLIMRISFFSLKLSKGHARYKNKNLEKIQHYGVESVRTALQCVRKQLRRKPLAVCLAQTILVFHRSRVVPATSRFFVAEFILSEVEGLFRMTSSKITVTEY